MLLSNSRLTEAVFLGSGPCRDALQPLPLVSRELSPPLAKPDCSGAGQAGRGDR